MKNLKMKVFKVINANNVNNNLDFLKVSLQTNGTSKIYYLDWKTKLLPL